MNLKEAIRKIVGSQLTVDEEKELLDRPSVIRRMKNEWDNPAVIDKAVNPDKIWAAIYRKTIGNPDQRRILYYKVYCVAASLLLLLSVGLAIAFYTRPTDVMYVTSCGRQAVDSVELSDGSRIILSANSKVTYPKEFRGRTRRVQLFGQAFFRVAKDASKPFIVETESMEVTALGTSFEVFSFGKELSETILLSGKVKVEPKLIKADYPKSYILLPDSRLSLLTDGRVLIDHVDARKYSAWRNRGNLTFQNEKLSMILPRVEKWYGRKIFCDSALANSQRFTFTINDESLETLLEMIKNVSPLSYLRRGDTYMIVDSTKLK